MNEYSNILNKITSINEAIGLPDLAKYVSKLINNNEKKIYVAVLGQFKSGKSSLLNNLLNLNILPTGIVPVTAIVTQIRFGVQPNLIIKYLNGTEAHVPFDSLSDYVTEKLNPENIKQVDIAIVEHPILEPFKNIILVDTPGLGSFYRHNSEVTQHWLPFTGVAIISVSAERPLSEEDINLIKNVTFYCPNIALVITKIDLFKPHEIAEIQSYITGSLKKVLNSNVTTFFYSIYQNSNNYRNQLLDKLIMPLNENAEIKFNEIIHHKIQTLVDQSITYTKLAIQSALKLEEEKDSVNIIIQEIRNNFHYHEKEMLLSGSSFKSDMRDKLEQIILPFQLSIIEKINQKFDVEYKNWRGSLFMVSRMYENWLNENIGNEIIEIDKLSFDRINQIVKEIINYYQYSALRFRKLLDEKVTKAFGIHLPEAYWQIDFTGIDKPDISIYRAFDSHIDLLLFFLPMKWVGSIFYNHFKNQIPYEVEKNLHRYISELNGKISKTIDNIYRQAQLYVINEIKTVENILQHSNTNLSELNEYLAQLNTIKNQILIS